MNPFFRNDLPGVVLGGVLTCLVFTVSLASAQSVIPEGKDEILVIGTGPIIQENVAQAKNAALSEALVRGVEAYLNRKLGSKGMMNNFTRIVHQVLPRAKDQIENFNILAEEKVGKHYKILVRLKVNEKMMEELFREIGLLVTEGPSVRVLFLVAQDLMEAGGGEHWWVDPEKHRDMTPTEISLFREFQSRGLQPVNRTVSSAEGRYSDEMKVPGLTGTAATEWGRLYSADVVVVGKCEVQEGGVVSVSLNALDVGTESTIVQGRETEQIVEDQEGEDPIRAALEKAVNRVASGMCPAIMKAFEAVEAAGTRLEITLQGLSSYKQFREFETFLKNEMPGVKSVKKRRIQGNSITISVEFSGGREQFLEFMLSHENFPFLADVEKGDGGEIVMQVR